MAKPSPYRIGKSGVLLSVRLTPNAAKDEICGLVRRGDDQCALQIRVRAQPEKGKANTALIKVLAKALSLPKSKLSLAAGHKDRNKTILLAGEVAFMTRQLRDTLSRFQAT